MQSLSAHTQTYNQWSVSIHILPYPFNVATNCFPCNVWIGLCKTVLLQGHTDRYNSCKSSQSAAIHYVPIIGRLKSFFGLEGNTSDSTKPLWPWNKCHFDPDHLFDVMIETCSVIARDTDTLTEILNYNKKSFSFASLE